MLRATGKSAREMFDRLVKHYNLRVKELLHGGEEVVKYNRMRMEGMVGAYVFTGVDPEPAMVAAFENDRRVEFHATKLIPGVPMVERNKRGGGLSYLIEPIKE